MRLMESYNNNIINYWPHLINEDHLIHRLPSSVVVVTVRLTGGKLAYILRISLFRHEFNISCMMPTFIPCTNMEVKFPDASRICRKYVIYIGKRYVSVLTSNRGVMEPRVNVRI